MAKQKGTIQIKGRLRNESYYFLKGGKSGFIRTIDPNASERVKTGENYAGFRARGAEFGSIGKFVSLWFGAMSGTCGFTQSRDRVSAVTRYLLPYLNADTEHEVGSRDIRYSGFQKGFIEQIQRYSKHDPYALYRGMVNIEVAERLQGQPVNVTINFYFPSALYSYMQYLGINRLRITFFTLFSYAPYKPAAGVPYVGGVPSILNLREEFVDIRQDVPDARTSSVIWVNEGNSAAISFVLAITPQRRLNNNEIIDLAEYQSYFIQHITQ